MNNKAHADVYLKIGHCLTVSDNPMVGRTDLEMRWEEHAPSIVLAGWHYHLDAFAVQLLLATRAKHSPPGSWHPKHGTSRLRVGDFR